MRGPLGTHLDRSQPKSRRIPAERRTPRQSTSGSDLPKLGRNWIDFGSMPPKTPNYPSRGPLRPPRAVITDQDCPHSRSSIGVCEAQTKVFQQFETTDVDFFQVHADVSIRGMISYAYRSSLRFCQRVRVVFVVGEVTCTSHSVRSWSMPVSTSRGPSGSK